MNSVNGGAFFDDENATTESSAPRAADDIVQDHGLPTPNGMVSSHHGKDVNHHHSKSKEGKKEHSKDKHREHKHKDHKHSKEHKSKENHVSSSKEHVSSKHHHHHHKDDKAVKDKNRDKSKDGISKDKPYDPSKPKHSGDKEKHKSKDEKHKSDKHKSSNDPSITDDKPKDPLKLVIKPKDGSVHPSEKHSSKHSSDKHSSEKHSSEKHSSEKHSSEKHSSEKHSSEKHSSEKHSSEKHSSEKHSSDKHSSDKHSSEKHPPEKHSSEKHSSEKHSSEKHSSSDKHKVKHSSDKHSSNKHSSEKREKSKSDKVKIESSNKEKNKEEKHNKVVKEEKVKIKTEPISSPLQIKTEPQNDEESPPQRQMVGMKSPSKLDRTVKKEKESEESDDEPLASRMEKVKKKQSDSSKKRKSDDEDFKPLKKAKIQKQKAKVKRPAPFVETASPKKGKKQEEEQDVWKWWEEEKKEDGVKWKTLQHHGPVFAPDYVPLPKSVKFYYDGKHILLSPEAEEVAGFYARMLDHDYVTKDSFNTNFFKDWRKTMTDEEKQMLKDLSKCNFKEIDAYYKMKSEERKAMTKEEKLVIKKENEELQAKYGFCIIDGHKQKIGNFKIEPPGLFRGRGEHPKMGMLKRRVVAKDIIINLGKEATVPSPPPGQKWKEVRHDNAVTWLACWTENILGSNKYIMLNPSSKLKGEKDWQKYELARKLKKCAPSIQKQYQEDWKSKEMRVRQRAVALYFIDKLALRAGNEKEEGETADTVGCCSLRVEHITLDNEKDGKECVVTFDFLGKDSIRYVNSVPVEKRVFKNLKLFMENKQPGDDLFDRLNTSILNKYLNDLMEGLTAKVFRTYNASKTLQEQLDKLTEENMSVPEKMLAYNRANRAVAILCNHQRSVPKTFDKQMETLQTKIQEKEQVIRDHKREMKDAKNRDKALYEKKKKRLAQLQEQLQKLEVQATDKEENKQIALGTSKLNYLDPRISVAWCKKWGVPIEKIYNKTQRDKFRWAIEMATADYKF